MAKPEPDEAEPPFGDPDSRADQIEPALPSTRHVVRTVLLYGAFGPPIGASLFILAGIVLSLGNTGGVTVGFRNSITAVPGFVFLSYVLMEIPALIAGFFVGFLPRRWTALWFVFCAGLIGDLVTAGYLGTGSNGSFGGLAIMPLLGGVSAGTLALALRYILHPHPNPSA